MKGVKSYSKSSKTEMIFNEEELDFIKTCAKQCLAYTSTSGISEDFLLDIIFKCKTQIKDSTDG